MSSKPTYIDLGNEKPASPSPDLPSPRSGEVPPALSPLDAFALQSRLLAQQLDASRNNGRRMSRLPPLTIASELAKPRPGYFSTTPRSAQPEVIEDPSSFPSSAASRSGVSPDVAQPSFRPKSHYPFIQASGDAESVANRDSTSTIKPVYDNDESSPAPITFTRSSPLSSEPSAALPTLQEHDVGAEDTSKTPSIVGGEPALEPPPKLSIDPVSYKAPNTLAVPGSPPASRVPWALRKEAGFRATISEHGDDSDSQSLQGDVPDRKFSTGGAASSRPISPFTPLFTGARSPSISSEHSPNPRASVNFSRPLSRADRFENRPSEEGSIRSQVLESPPLRASSDSRSVHGSSLDSPQLPSAPGMDATTPLSLTDDERSIMPDPGGAPSYIYAKYSLPRGRVLSRNSILNQEMATHKFEWEPPKLGQSNVATVKNDQSNQSNRSEPRAESVLPEFRTSRIVMASIPDSGSALRSRSADAARAGSTSLISENPEAAHSLVPDATAQETKPGAQLTPGGPLSTLAERRSFDQNRASEPTQVGDLQKQMTPEGHLATGIQCHEDGEVMKSTYHLRLAARGGNATGMLLYALACRHGWGMRANQAEGVKWLRKAVDSAGLEVADDESGTTVNIKIGDEPRTTSKTQNDFIKRKVHKAQFALSIYELGVSYMNGWGIQQDKQLGLRCFEISGSWGDGDALAEAGFCYAKGVGCKKDLKKAAEYYRRAEKLGVEMAGNSWIYKEKYMPQPNRAGDDERRSRSTDKGKPSQEKREKSRTRAIFSRRRKEEQYQQQHSPAIS